MNIDVKKLIKNYRSDMTADEVIEALASSDGLVSREDYQALVNKNDSLAKQNGDLRKQANANKSEQELAQQETQELIEKLQADNKNLSRQIAIADNEKNFVAQGYSVENATKIATALVDGDMKTFFRVSNQHQEETKRALTEELAKQTRRPEGTDTGSEPKVTRESLAKMTIAEVQKFAQDHPDEYNAIYGGK